MSREITMSLAGLYQWDNTLFDLFTWPDEFIGDEPTLDKEAFIGNLIAETMNLEILYPNPAVMKNLMAVWSRKQLPVWNHMIETTMYDYNPIENYDRNEQGTDVDTHSGTDESSNTLTRAGADTVTDTPDTTTFEAAYDAQATATSDGLQPRTRVGGENISETAYDSSDTNEGSMTYGHEIEHTHNLRVHGNIGTVTAQKMITEEREIAAFNIYDYMIKEFRQRFCLLVY